MAEINIEEYNGLYPCVKCGYCCTKGCCQFGIYDDKKQSCIYFTEDRLCSKHDEIVKLEKDSKYPMFYGGCSSPLFNTVRNEKIKELGKEKK